MRRILYFVLILAMISFNITGTAFASAQTDAEKAEAAERLYAAAGALVPSASADGTISREAFLLSLISALRIDAEIRNEPRLFADVDPDSTLGSAVRYAVALGIVAPGEYFYPERSVTYAECFKMLVTALGFGDEAQLRGGYPSGYLVIASLEKLNNDLAYAPDAALVKENFYILMRNFLEAPTRNMDSIVVGNGEISTKYEKGQCILELVYDWTPFDGIVNGNENTYLYDNSLSTAEDSILIGDKLYKCSGDFILGMRVTGYSAEIDSKDTVVFSEVSRKNTVITIAAKDFLEITDKAVTAENENGRKRSYNLAGLHSVIYNGKFFSGAFADGFEIDTGSVTLIDNDSNSSYDVVYIRDGGIMKIGSVNDYTEKIYDAVSGESIDFSGNYTTKVYQNGAASSVAALKAGDVIEYYRSKDNEFTEMWVLSNTVSGILQTCTEDEALINDVTYGTAKYFRTFDQPSSLLGRENTYVLTESGDVATVAAVGASRAILAYAVRYNLSELSDAVEIRLYNEFGEYLLVQTADEVRYNREKLTYNEVYARLAAVGEQAIMYRLNSEGEISVINTENSIGIYNPSQDSAENLKRYNFENYSSTSASKITYKSFGLFVPFFSLDASTKIILVDDPEYTSGEERFSIGTTASWSNDSTFVRSSLLAYNVESSGRANILICKSGGSGNAVGSSSPSGVVDSVRAALDTQEETAYQITLCAGNQYKVFYVPMDSELKSIVADNNGNILLERGDFVRYTVNQRDEFTDLVVDFDFGKQDITHAVTRENHELNYYYGTVNAFSNSSVSLTLLESSNTNAVTGAGYSVSLIMNRPYVWLVDTQNKTVTAVSPSSIVSSELDALNPDKILLKTRYAEVTEAVIYR